MVLTRWARHSGGMTTTPEPNTEPASRPAARTLRRSSNKMIAGVIAGVAEYFDIDVSLARLLAFIALLFSAGTVFVAYIVAWIIVPGPGHEPSILDRQRHTPPPAA
jgi:phage shock protein C